MALIDQREVTGTAQIRRRPLKLCFDKPIVNAQNVGYVRVRFGELNQELKELAQRDAAAALRERDAQPPQACVGDLPDLLVRRDAFGLALGGTRGDLVQQRP
jgi:hypothetical protein